MPKQTVLGYIRQNVQLSGENFVTQYSKLTDKDKADLARWARDEAAAMGIELA